MLCFAFLAYPKKARTTPLAIQHVFTLAQRLVRTEKPGHGKVDNATDSIGEIAKSPDC